MSGRPTSSKIALRLVFFRIGDRGLAGADFLNLEFFVQTQLLRERVAEIRVFLDD